MVEDLPSDILCSSLKGLHINVYLDLPYHLRFLYQPHINWIANLRIPISCTKDLSSTEIKQFHPEDPAQVSSIWCYILNHSSSPCLSPTTNCTIINAIQVYVFVSASGFPKTTSSIWSLPQFVFEANAKLPLETSHPSYAPTLR